MSELFVPCSFMQEEAIADHVLLNKKLVIVGGERHRIQVVARRRFPGCVVTGAHLDIENARWKVTVEV